MNDERYSRQSFLGQRAEGDFSGACVGLVGLGGGGSHIVQQLAYAGFTNFVLYDGDIGKDGNLNRTIGLTPNDIVEKMAKVDVAIRIIRSLHPAAKIERYQMRWQECPEPLRTCDLVFGCVCQSALKIDPPSASKIDPPQRLVFV